MVKTMITVTIVQMVFTIMITNVYQLVQLDIGLIPPPTLVILVTKIVDVVLILNIVLVVKLQNYYSTTGVILNVQIDTMLMLMSVVNVTILVLPVIVVNLPVVLLVISQDIYMKDIVLIPVQPKCMETDNT